MTINSLERKSTRERGYEHARYERRRRFLRFLIRTIGFNFLGKIERIEGVENIPTEGPAILLMNHIAFIDPILVLHATPRNIVPMAKAEVYREPVWGIFPLLWGVIPVHREEVDRRAIMQVLEVLRAGEIVLVAPEGTRSPQLSQAKEGVAYLAAKSGAPVVPAAVDGTIGFPALRFFSKRWREPGGSVRFGRPFRYKAEFSRPAREQLRLMTDEAMYALAALLPEHRRGYYSDLSQATRDTIEYL